MGQLTKVIDEFKLSGTEDGKIEVKSLMAKVAIALLVLVFF